MALAAARCCGVGGLQGRLSSSRRENDGRRTSGPVLVPRGRRQGAQSTRRPLEVSVQQPSRQPAPSEHREGGRLLPSLAALAAAAGAAGAAGLAGAAQAAGAAASAAEVLASQGLTLQDACAQEFGVDDLNTLIVAACVVEFLALTGAAVGGVVARQRKQEVEKINAQLRQININLRKQARVESYAPALSYAPVGAPAAAAAAAATTPAPSKPSEVSADVSADSRKEELLRILRVGKQHLRQSNPAGAVSQFQRALALAQEIGDAVEEKKAARGVGASLQRQGKYQDAIKYHQLVLATSQKRKEHSGDTEAYGAIADCYTEMGDLENAAKYYDRYINRLEDEE